MTKEQALSSRAARYHLFPPRLVAAQARVRATTEGSSLLLKLLLLLLETAAQTKRRRDKRGKNEKNSQRSGERLRLSSLTFAREFKANSWVTRRWCGRKGANVDKVVIEGFTWKIGRVYFVPKSK